MMLLKAPGIKAEKSQRLVRIISPPTMEHDDDDGTIVRFDLPSGHGTHSTIESIDSTNYMAMNHAAKQSSNQNAQSDKPARKTRHLKLKLTSMMLLAPPGLTLLAKQCRQARIKRKEGREGLQLAQLIQLYDAWAKQLCPGHDIHAFYNKLGKMGNERAVKDHTEALIAARNKGDLDALHRHTEETEAIVYEHRATIERKRMVMDDADEAMIEEESSMMKSLSKPLSTIKAAPTSVPVPLMDDNIEIELPDGDFAEPEGLDASEFGGFDD
jgi:hypothetical protein